MRSLVVLLVLLLCTTIDVSAESVRERLLRDVSAHGTRDGAAVRERTSVSDLVLLYGSEAQAAGVGTRELATLYENAYQSGLAGRTWLQRLEPHGGWIVMVLSILALFFRETLKSLGGRLWRKSKAVLYRRFARTAVYRRIALRHYREALRRAYEKVELPFLDQPLAMENVYVPLLLKDSADGKPLDAVQCLRTHRRIIVTGLPGSGKSMLVKSLAYKLARTEVPVVVELHRRNHTTRSLMDLIPEAFERCGFPDAKDYVSAALQSGDLTLLLDGLDEVGSATRGAVIREIRDLLSAYEHCHVVITSRGTAYDGQFEKVKAFDIDKFNNDQVRAFLANWPAPLPVDEVLDALSERRHIQELARTPLLLTIIAFLHSRTGFNLPRSRAQFYSEALNVLLNSWQNDYNRYDAHDKWKYLESLALRNHELATANASHNFRLFAEHAVLSEVRQHLDRIHLDHEKPREFLDEIVQRSGILVRLENGRRYEFAHLTLQEFLAASALADAPETLLRHYDANRELWREVVTLWCGLVEDCTAMVAEIAKRDPIHALACLGDARFVDEAVAAGIVHGFETTFGDDAQHETVIAFFAAAAAEKHAQGERTRRFLRHMLVSANGTARASAARILVRTASKAGADTLAAAAADSSEARSALVQMGDAAVPAIVRSRLHPQLQVALLRTIGTPLAVTKLELFFSKSVDRAGRQAAAYLLSMLSPEVVSALDHLGRTTYEKRVDSIWEPFESSDESSAAAVIERAAYVVLKKLDDLPNVYFDDRVAIGLLVYVRERDSIWKSKIEKTTPPETLRELYARIAGSAARQPQVSNYLLLYDLVDELTKKPDHPEAASIFEALFARHPDVLLLLRHVRPELRGTLAARLLAYPYPEMTHWRRVLKPVDYHFDRGWHLAATLLLTFGTFAIGAYALHDAGYPKVAMGASTILVIAALSLVFTRNRGDRFTTLLTIVGVGWFFLLTEWWRAIRQPDIVGIIGWPFAILAAVALDAVALALLYAAFLWIEGIVVTRPTALLLLAAIVGVALMAWNVGQGREREARNPLHGLLA